MLLQLFLPFFLAARSFSILHWMWLNNYHCIYSKTHKRQTGRNAHCQAYSIMHTLFYTRLRCFRFRLTDLFFCAFLHCCTFWSFWQELKPFTRSYHLSVSALVSAGRTDTHSLTLMLFYFVVQHSEVFSSTADGRYDEEQNALLAINKCTSVQHSRISHAFFMISYLCHKLFLL